MSDPARARFLILSGIRILGALAMMIGLVIAYGRWEGATPVIGVIVTILGAFGFAVAPRLLARRWRSPE
jgi:uncharacterized membrane protein